MVALRQASLRGRTSQGERNNVDYHVRNVPVYTMNSPQPLMVSLSNHIKYSLQFAGCRRYIHLFSVFFEHTAGTEIGHNRAECFFNHFYPAVGDSIPCTFIK
jgi:hypothetical protein